MKLVIDHYSEIRDGTWKGTRFTFPDRSVCRQEAKRIFVECLSHVGSTSVPGATAKPYIDMKCDIYDCDSEDQVAFCTVSADLSIVACDNVFGSPFFERQGYCQYGRKIQQQPEPYKLDQRYWYRHSRDESSACKGYFIHIGREPMASFALELRSDASLVQQYNEAKRRIVADHPLISFADYTMLKTAFIQRVLSSRFDNVDASKISSKTPSSMYELIHFITSTAAGHAPSAQPLLFAPNDVFEMHERGMYCVGFAQVFTPLGLALILAVEPRLSALWDRYDPGHHIWGDFTAGNFGTSPLDGPPSDSERVQRLACFAPVISRLRQHGCTVASFVSCTAYTSPILDAANKGGADCGGIEPADNSVILGEFEGWDDLSEEQHARRQEEFERSLKISLPGAAPEVYAVLDTVASIVGKYEEHRKVLSCICLPELRNFGRSAAVLFNGIASIARLLDSLHLTQHLSAFIKENVTDDIMISLTTDDLRALGLSIGDARRFSIAVQQEQAALHVQDARAVAAGGGSIVGNIISISSALPSASLSKTKP